MQIIQVGARFNAQIADERAARSLIRGQRFRSAPRSVEREHQQEMQALTQGVRGRQPPQSGHNLVMPAEVQIRLNTRLHRLLYAGPKGGS